MTVFNFKPAYRVAEMELVASDRLEIGCTVFMARFVISAMYCIYPKQRRAIFLLVPTKMEAAETSRVVSCFASCLVAWSSQKNP